MFTRKQIRYSRLDSRENWEVKEESKKKDEIPQETKFGPAMSGGNAIFMLDTLKESISLFFYRRLFSLRQKI